MIDCEGPVERARCVLAILNEAAGANEGYFFGLRGGRAELMCAAPEQAAPAALAAAVDVCLRDALTSAAEESSQANAQRTRSGHYVLLPLAATSLGQRVVAGVVALSAEASVPDPKLLETLASALIDHDDVDASTCAL